MAHRSRIQVILIDHPSAVAAAGYAFWARAVGDGPDATISDRSEFTRVAGLGNGIVLAHQRLGQGEPRMHLDIETDDVEAEVTRLERLGARRLRRVEGLWQMADPAGLVFCVVPVQSDDFPAHATAWPD